MVVLKCKMCGGTLEIQEGMTVCECEYCGSIQTVPTLDDEKKINLFARANRLRSACEFDKAAGIYESIVAEFMEEAEAYWGLILCKYGIEYVDDPRTGKKIPTCHRSSFDSVMEDSNFELVMEYSDAFSRNVYRKEAKEIEELRKGILEVSSKEEPYDIFISYKETDLGGNRTVDSVIAQDVYDELVENGYRVFFSRITLEDKLGQEYEPYIFAALNSAKVMLVFGTDYEYYNAVWVKNEWSRFLHLIEKGEKKTLIPCYKGIDAYDMPKEFARLQAQDMGKVGAIQDLLRGIGKIIPKNKGALSSGNVGAQVANPTTESLVKRAFMYLEDGEWDNADEYFEKVLDIDPECAYAYLGKLMAELRIAQINELKDCVQPFDDKKNYQKAVRFADDALRSELQGYVKSVLENAEIARRDSVRSEAKSKMDKNDIYECKQALKLWESISGWNDADEQKLICQKKLEELTEKFKKSRERQKLYKRFIAVGGHIVGLKTDGTVVVTGKNVDGRCNVADWTDIIGVSVSNHHTVGLKSDGTVVAAGSNYNGKSNVTEWRDIIEVATSDYHTVGLKADGTVVAVGNDKNGNLLQQCNVMGWKDIVSISAADSHTVGLKADGTVVAVGNDKNGNLLQQCNVTDWKDIVEVATSDYHTVGLKADGTVLVAGDKKFYSQCDVAEWRDIIAISVSNFYIIGLKLDGTVVLSKCIYKHARDTVKTLRNIIDVGNGYYTDNFVALKSDGTVISVEAPKEENKTIGWKNIIAIVKSSYYIVGLTSDGKVVVAVGEYAGDEIDTSGWKLFKDCNKIEAELEEVKFQKEQQILAEKRKRLQQEEEARKQEEQKAKYRALGRCQYCGGVFKGLFTKRCNICYKEKDY